MHQSIKEYAALVGIAVAYTALLAALSSATTGCDTAETAPKPAEIRQIDCGEQRVVDMWDSNEHKLVNRYLDNGFEIVESPSDNGHDDWILVKRCAQPDKEAP